MVASKSPASADPVINDLGPLAWVLGEVRTSLEASSKALKRFVRDAAENRGKDLASLDSSQLRLAKQQLRQVVGALEMVDLEKPAHMLRAMESAVERFIQSPELCSEDAADKIENAGFALTAYLENMLAGRHASAVALFAQYEDVQKLAASTRIHPADLWEQKWRWLPIAAPTGVSPLELTAEARSQMDAPVLQVMRNTDNQAALTLSQTAAAFSLSAQMSPQQQSLWRLASGFFAAVAYKLLPADLYVKRALTGVLLQANEQIKDASSVNTRLAQDLLFFNANILDRSQAPAAVTAVLTAYQLQNARGVDYHKRVFGHYDPALLVQARKRIAAVKETWSLVTAGESNKYQLIKDQIQAIAESIAKLFPAGPDLSQALLTVADHILRTARPPGTHVAMEVATSLLYAEAVLEDADLSNPALEARTQRLAERIQNAQQGGVASPLDPWMEELYRHVSDRQNMGSVVGELKITLGELEKLMDQFFRNTEDLNALMQVPGRLAQMRGVMSILGLDDAIKAVQWMREHIEHLASAQLSVADAQSTGVFDKIGANLGALGFLIDMLSYQPALAKKLFIYDNDSKELKPLMGRASSTPADQASVQESTEAELATPAVHTLDSVAEAAPSPALEPPAIDLPEIQEAPTLTLEPTSTTELTAAMETAAEIPLEPVAESTLTLTTASESAAFVLPEDSSAVIEPTATPSSTQADEPIQLDTAAAVPASAPANTSAPAASTASANTPIEGLDDELLEIFLEEASEVVTQGLGAISNLRSAPNDNAELTTLRRSFHTLKGSSRMVGLNNFGESAWAMEQVLNTWLADAKPASDGMLDLSQQAMEIFGTWTEQLRTSRSDGVYHPAPFQASSEAMRTEQRYEALQFASAEVAPQAPVEEVSSPALPDAPTKLPSLDEILLQQSQATEAPSVELDAIDTIATTEPEVVNQISDAAALAFFEPIQTPPTELSNSTQPTHSELETPIEIDHSLLSPVTEGRTEKVKGLEAGLPLIGETEASSPVSLTLTKQTQAEVFDLQLDATEVAPAPEALEEPKLDIMNPEQGLAVETQEPALSTLVEPIKGIETEPEDESCKIIGDLRVSIPLYNAFLGEADDWSRRLVSEITEWALDSNSELSNSTVALAHSLAGASGTVGHLGLSELARNLEHCLARDLHLDTAHLAHRHAATYTAAAEEIRHLLHQFAAGILQQPTPHVQEQLQLALQDEDTSAEASNSARMHIEDLLLAAESEIIEAAPALETPALETPALDIPAIETVAHTPQADIPDNIDTALFPIFEEEAQELLPELGQSLRQWHAHPEDMQARSSVLRVLHTLKGSARLAGAMQLGSMVHELESHIEILGADNVPAAEIEALIHRNDDISDAYDALCARLQTGVDAVAADQTTSSSPSDDAGLATDNTAINLDASITAVEDTAETPVFADDSSPPQLSVESDHAPTSTTLTYTAAPEQIAVLEVVPAVQLSSNTTEIHQQALASAHFDGQIDAEDSIDENLFPIFEDEAQELLPELGNSLRQWHQEPSNTTARSTVLRVLHTLKGSARLAGAMRLGEMAHHLESSIEMLGAEQVAAAEIEQLLAANDDINEVFQTLRKQQAQADALPLSEPALALGATPATPADAEQEQGQAQKLVDQHLAALSDTAVATTLASIHSESAQDASTEAADALSSDTANALPARASYVLKNNESNTQTVRVRSHLLDLLVNLAGEVMITRAKLENEIGAQLRTAVNDLSSNLERLRQQLRDIEVQAESQMQSRLALSKETSQTFDPLEFDRFTRVQELTRMMAESVNDVATVQRNMQAVADATEGALVAQARQTRELQRYLLRTRMVEFDSISDRLYRVIRQAGKDTGKQVRLDIVGASIELDRGVLERMTPAFEHLLRNCVAHGIEMPQDRHAAGKETAGLITIQVRQEGNDVAIEFKDDGAGLNVARILSKAEEKGLIPPGTTLSENEIFELIYNPGFSTASEVSAISGRGVGMDVVKSEVQALGGRVETRSVANQGSSFKLVLPLTTAVTQVVMVRAGHITFGIPANLLEIVRRATPQELAQAYAEQHITFQGERIPFQWVGALLQASVASTEAIGRSTPIVIIRSAAQRVAVHVDEVLGNQEVVVKNLGPQLSRLPGLAGMTLLPSGAVVLIYNPVALHTVYSQRAQAFIEQAKANQLQAQQPTEAQTPLVMVVDDSITVRRVTQRLLQREGYRVLLANDGLMALEKLAEGEELPSIILSDIEMPRMDGFDLLRNIRADQRLSQLPVVMITSRMAEKHREHAMSLGANHYLGKPYGEEELLGLIQSYTHAQTA